MRLELIKKSCYFIDCKLCGLEYLPMTPEARANCPKCFPVSKLSDEKYLESEQKTEELISNENLYEDIPSITY